MSQFQFKFELLVACDGPCAPDILFRLGILQNYLDYLLFSPPSQLSLLVLLVHPDSAPEFVVTLIVASSVSLQDDGYS